MKAPAMFRLAVNSLRLSRLTWFHCLPSQSDHGSPGVPDTLKPLSLHLIHATWTRCAVKRCQAKLIKDSRDCTGLQQAGT